MSRNDLFINVIAVCAYKYLFVTYFKAVMRKLLCA